MAREMKIEIMSRLIVKPSTPTPLHRRIFTLSLLEQVCPPVYSATAFFYLSNTGENGSVSSQVFERCRRLKDSLSKTLVGFYPMAGRLRDGASIECNDQGAFFVEAKISCKLMDFLSQPDIELLNRISPLIDPETSELASGFLLLIQLAAFTCGGIVVVVCPSHKIIDGSSLSVFLQSWTSTTRGYGELVLPELIGGTLLPPRDMPAASKVDFPTQKCITRTFVFDAPKLARLKAKASRAVGQRPPTNVETVLSLIVKCAMAASRSVSKTPRPSVLFQTVNLRKRMVPPLPGNTIGNLIWGFLVYFEDNEMELQEMVAKMRKGLTEFCSKKANNYKGDEGFALLCESMKERGELYKRRDINVYRCTSMCKMRLYETDFGWGKPVWITNYSSNYFKNLIVLMDTKGGDGIEAWVTLEEAEMAIFEQNQVLLEFASFNPSAFVNRSRL